MNHVSLSKDLLGARRPTWGRVNHHRLEVVRQFAGHDILDLGCASGEYVGNLRNLGYKAFGMDLLAYNEWLQKLNAFCFQGDIRDLPFSSCSADTVLAFEILEHVHQPEIALAEIHRVCKVNLILSVPDCEIPQGLVRSGMIYSHWIDRTHCNFFDRNTLKALLESCGFELQFLRQINPVLVDFPVFRSFYLPLTLAYQLARITLRFPLRKKFYRTLLVVANRVSK